MNRACWQLVLGRSAMPVWVDGLIGWSRRRSFSSEDIAQIWPATPVQLRPSSIRWASRAR